MIKDKDMADKIQMKKETGLVHIYTGDGKGKTTAAAGLALRAAGRGLKVIFAQFMKGRASGEVDALAQIPDVMVLRASKDYGFYSRMSEADRNMQKKVRWKSSAGLFFVRNSDFKKVKGLNLLYHAFIMVIVYHAYLQNVCILFK